jgi:hypothetical protein
MSIEMKFEASPNWTLVEGQVDTYDDHFKINYGDELQTVALVGQGQGEVFKVQFVKEANGDSQRYQEMIEDVRREIDRIFIKKQKKDPWSYAIMRCISHANHLSKIRWGYFPKRSDTVFR